MIWIDEVSMDSMDFSGSVKKVVLGGWAPSVDGSVVRYSPPFINHKKAIWKGSHNPILRDEN